MASLNSWALTTVADVKESLGIVTNTQDNLIIRKINQATDMIEAYCGFDTDHHFVSATYTNETYNGTGTNELLLRARPVTAISSLQRRSSGENVDDWDSFNSEDFFFSEHSGMVTLLGGFMQSTSGFRITYTAGYTTIPSDLSEACVTLASYLVEHGTSGAAIKRKKEGSREIEYAVSLTDKSIIEQLDLDAMLSRYVLPTLAGW